MVRRLNGAHLQPDTSRHPAMHRSPTTDYIILLSGEITLVLDKEERTLKPFDCVIQRALITPGSTGAPNPPC
jgi:mannose-6-phosphate isomerase-like protein (cupin superfamily)